MLGRYSLSVYKVLSL